jgi:prepilin-type N-terminal cleavage/methylation domain-containing protein
MTSRIRHDGSLRPGRARGPRRVLGGFTLLEVMLALAILSITLVGLLGRATGNVRLTQEVAMRGTVAALARGQMYEIEDLLLREGFQELDQTLEDDFGDQGWPDIHWQASIEKVELPGLGSLQALQGGAGEGTGEDGAAGGEQAGGGLLSSMLSLGGGAATGTGEDTSADASFISSQFEILRQVLEASIRKVTLTVTWEVGKEEQKMIVACYFTDPAAMQKVLPGVGALAGGGGGEGEESPGGGGGGGVGGGGGGPIPPRNPRVGVPPR